VFRTIIIIIDTVTIAGMDFRRERKGMGVALGAKALLLFTFGLYMNQSLFHNALIIQILINLIAIFLKHYHWMYV